MRATVQFLNVGWGDAHLIRLPSGKVTLIDGGDGLHAPDRDHPLDWMRRHGVDRLDWMILTHIHGDHLNGLIEIAREYKVERAVLPYKLPDLTFASDIGLDPSNHPLSFKVYEMLEDYETFIRLLHEQGTDIRWRSEYASEETSALWEEEGFKLTHLYPWQGDPIPGLDVLARIAGENDRPEAERFAELSEFWPLTNDDSSVYRLDYEENSADGVLLGGDQVQYGWDRLAGRVDLKSRIWKVPHHGLDDAFTAQTLSQVSPEVCVIPICLERAEPLRAHWEQLSDGTESAFFLDRQVTPGNRVRLVEGHIEVWIGD